MNGREIEHMLTMIDESIDRSRASSWSEILRYLTDHEAVVLNELRTTRKVSVPTLAGPVEIQLADLEALVA